MKKEMLDDELVKDYVIGNNIKEINNDTILKYKIDFILKNLDLRNNGPTEAKDFVVYALEEILTESDSDLNDINNNENIEEKRFKNEIKNALNNNKAKQNEINDLKNYYNNLILKKDGIINALESQINPNILKDNDENNNVINENINNNDMGSIKELNLDSENMYINNNNNIQKQIQENNEDNMNNNNNYYDVNGDDYNQYEQEGEQYDMNEEIQDLADLGENEGEEELNNEYQNGEYNQYLQQQHNDEDDDGCDEGQMNEEFEEEGEEQGEYYRDIDNMNYGNEGLEDYDKDNLEIKDLDI